MAARADNSDVTLLRIIGNDLPGRACGDYANVHVGLQVGLEPEQIAPADVYRVVFLTHISILETGPSRYDFRGTAVHGRPHRRFVYLTWGNPDETGFNMFRRARLMLDDIDAEVVGGALLDGALEGSLCLSDGGELPRSGTVRPPVVRWSAMTAPRFAPPLYEPH